MVILLLAFIWTFYPGNASIAPTNPNTAFLDHWHRTSRLFKRYQPEATQYETFVFAKASFYGVNGDPAVLPITACLSCREGGYKTKNGQGRMGGHKLTILAGSKLLDGPISDPVARWKWLNRHPDHKIACLSAQFKHLHDLKGKEIAVRMWNKGMDWRCDVAGSYWKDVQVMENYYFGGRR